MTKSGRTPAGRDFSGPARTALRVFKDLHAGVYRATSGRVAGRLMGPRRPGPGALRQAPRDSVGAVYGEVEQRPEEQPYGGGVEASLAVGLLHQLEGYRGDQHPRPHGHHHGDDPLRSAGLEASERLHEQRGAPHEAPESRQQRLD